MSQLELEGALERRKLRRRELTTRIDANVRAVKGELSIATVTPAAELRLQEALVHLHEAARQQKELREVDAEIARIQEELHG